MQSTTTSIYVLFAEEINSRKNNHINVKVVIEKEN